MAWYWKGLRTAVIGFSLGSLVADVLLRLARGGGESAEGAAILAYLLSLPISWLLAAVFDWGHYANQWLTFIRVAPATNGAVLGFLIGGIPALLRTPLRDPSQSRHGQRSLPAG